VDKSASCGVQ